MTVMSTDITDDRITAEQRLAVYRARDHITEDGDRRGAVRLMDDFTVRVNQISEGETVREWIAYPNGRLTWRT